MPTELNLTVSLIWDGMIGLNNWVGYALAAIYYLGTDYDFGLTYCEVLGYLYYVIDGLNYIVNFAGIAPEEGQTMEEAVAGLSDQIGGIATAAIEGDTDGLIDAATGLAGEVAGNAGEIVAAGEELVDGVTEIVDEATEQAAAA